MSPPQKTDRDAILARLAETRAEIGRLLEPPPDGDHDTAAGPAIDGQFPRSRTMRALMTGRGLGAAGAIASGLLLSRPRLVWRLLRVLPTSAVARMVLGRVIGSMRGRR
jgi:hypothetical protein